MTTPSSQVAAIWVQQVLDSTSWQLLREVLFNAVKQNCAPWSDDAAWEYVEGNLCYVAEHLRDTAAECRIDGTAPIIEIDSDPNPYVRLSAPLPSDVISKLRNIDPYQLEDVCAAILNALGARSHVTQRTNDGGVDFVAYNFKTVPRALTVPSACMATVIGQAKRYREGNTISETKLREFIGAATLKRHELTTESKIAPLAPVLFAFWTTSDFDQNAKQYARKLGVWHMDGITLGNYVVELGLKAKIMSLPDHSSLQESLLKGTPETANFTSEAAN